MQQQWRSLCFSALVMLALFAAALAQYDCEALQCDPCKDGKRVKLDFIFVIDLVIRE